MSGKMNAKAQEREAERLEHVERLRGWFPKGSTVYTVLRHVSASGMTRHISVISLQAGDMRDIPGATTTLGMQKQRREVLVRHPNYSASIVLGYRLKNAWNDSLIVSGCGSDMGFEVAYNLGRALYGDGYSLQHAWL